MLASPDENSSSTSIYWRAQVAFWLSLLALAAFIAILGIAGFAPKVGVADDFVHGRSFDILSMPSKLMLLLALIVWVLALLGSISLEASVIGHSQSRTRQDTVGLNMLMGISILLILLQFAMVFIILTIKPPPPFRFLTFEYLWNLISFNLFSR
jgi:hypothetical protein